MRDAIAVQLLGAVDKRSAKLAIKNALAVHRDSATIANALFVPAVLADLAGQLMVHAYEVPHGKERRQMALGEGQDVRAFLAMGWQEALDYFRARGLVTERELERLLKRKARESEKARDLMLDRVQARVYELLGDAIGEGSTYREFATSLREDADGLGITMEDPGYLNTVFRTSTMDAYGAGRQRAMQHPAVVEARPFRQIRTAGDGRVRPEHDHADGVVFRADGPLAGLRTPFGFNCFPGHVRVQGRFNVGTRALYDGEIVEVTTKHGRRLAITPNHAVATVDGFLPAGALREGQNLVCYESGIDLARARPEPSAVDEHDAPARIEQVFRTLAQAGRSLVHRRGPDDFDGDALAFESDVEVVWADSKLPGRDETSVPQDAIDPQLPSTNASAVVPRGGGGHRLDPGRLGRPPAHGVPRGSALPLNQATVALHGRPLQEFRFGPASRLNPARAQEAADRGAADAEFLRELLLADPRHVTLDEVIGIRKLQWRDHVYDLQSPLGWIVAEGILTTNCRCAIVTLASWDGEVIESVPADLLDVGFGGL